MLSSLRTSAVKRGLLSSSSSATEAQVPRLHLHGYNFQHREHVILFIAQSDQSSEVAARVEVHRRNATRSS